MDDTLSGTKCPICKMGIIYFDGLTIEHNKIYRTYKCNSKHCMNVHKVESKIKIGEKPEVMKPIFWYMKD